MATWHVISQQRELMNKLRPVYEQNPSFPIELRHALAQWIENVFRTSSHLDPSNSNDHVLIKELMWNMTVEMDRLSAPGSTRPNFENRDITNILQYAISNIRIGCPDSVLLFQHIRTCLRMETELLHEQEFTEFTPSLPTSSTELAEVVELETAMATMASFQIHQLGEFERTLDRLQICQEELKAIVQNFSTGSQSYAQMNELQQKNNDFCRLDSELHSQGQHCINELRCFLERTVYVTHKWKLEMKHVYEGKSAATVIPLQHLARLVNKLAQLMWAVRNMMQNAIRLKMSLPAYYLPMTTSSSSSSDSANTVLCEKFKTEVENMLKIVVFETTVVRVQPYQMLKADTRFTTSIQLLVGDQAFSLPKIKLSLLTDRQASAMVEGFRNTYGNTNASSRIEYKEERLAQYSNSAALIDGDISAAVEKTNDQEYCACFKSPKIKKTFKRVIEKEVREMSRSVLDVNYFIHYWGQFTAHGITFNIGAFSYPVKVITNGSQEQKSWETSIWDLATGALEPGHSEGRKPPTSWENLTKALNVCFFRQTGRGLTQENIDFIRQTLLPSGLSQTLQVNPHAYITLENFCMDPVGGGERRFNLWEWLFGVMKLIMEHLRGSRRPGRPQGGIWDLGYILGLVMADKTQELLYNHRNEVPGGFVLRFSPNVLNTITIEWIENDCIYCTRTTRKDLVQRSLADRLLDISKWEMLYNVDERPIPKTSVFRPSTPQGNIPPPREAVLSDGSAVVVKYFKNVLCTHVLSSPGTSMAVAGPSSSANLLRAS